MRRNRSDGDTVPLTLGQALTAQARLIVWCKACGHRAEPDVAEQVSHHGAGMIVIDWAARLRCQGCGERSADFVVNGASPSLPGFPRLLSDESWSCAIPPLSRN